MSLINDALKRAKATQPKGVSAVGPSLHPVETARRTDRPDILLPVLVGVILLLAGLLLWQWLYAGANVRARMVEAPAIMQPLAAAKPLPSIVQPTAPAPVVVAPTNDVATKAIVAPVEPPKPAPITYKLQGIFYWSRNPSAVINGKTVYPGSRVGDARVVTINQESAKLVTSSGQTIVLELK